MIRFKDNTATFADKKFKILLLISALQCISCFYVNIQTLHCNALTDSVYIFLYYNYTHTQGSFYRLSGYQQWALFLSC